MLARGIPHDEAEAMLIIAFLAEAIEELHNDAVRAMLIHRVEDWLRRKA
jgi:Fe-S cluster assembly protein SufD